MYPDFLLYVLYAPRLLVMPGILKLYLANQCNNSSQFTILRNYYRDTQEHHEILSVIANPFLFGEMCCIISKGNNGEGVLKKVIEYK